jgi:hypothetical protein
MSSHPVAQCRIADTEYRGFKLYVIEDAASARGYAVRLRRHADGSRSEDAFALGGPDGRTVVTRLRDQVDRRLSSSSARRGLAHVGH